jgi:hypothetical protein
MRQPTPNNIQHPPEEPPATQRNKAAMQPAANSGNEK